MRYTAWFKDDFFHPLNNVPIEMDASAVVLPESGQVPVGVNFDHMNPPAGRFFDIKIEDGEITGEVEWFESSSWDDDEMKKGFRLGVYISHVKREGHRITEAILREVDVMREEQAPKR